MIVKERGRKKYMGENRLREGSTHLGALQGAMTGKAEIGIKVSQYYMKWRKRRFV